MTLKPKVSSFFAGIGGFDLGFDQIGIKTVFQCEIDEYCRSVLQRHWPRVQKHSDILEVIPESIPESDIWCGGFPCQDVSVARGWLGRDGLQGKNTGLFFPFAELVKQKLPKVVLMENVTGLLSSHNGRDFFIILENFRQMGYGVAWRILNTRYFGAPQSRPRVYICAWRGSATNAFNVLYEPGPTTIPENQRLGFLRSSICEITGARVPEVAFCLAATSGRHTGTDWSRSYVSYEHEVRRLTPTECEALQGFPLGWTLPAPQFPLNHRDIDSLRYHAIGNAVSVPVVRWVASRIKVELDGSRKITAKKSIAKSNELMDAIVRVSDLKATSAKFFTLPSEKREASEFSFKWGRGGIMSRGECITAPVSASPCSPIPSRFVDVLEKAKPSKSYFLSPNAATGILRRVETQKRELFKPLDLALRRLAKKS
jgi:DNA (cytosine-5)-methyltransferase 1